MTAIRAWRPQTPTAEQRVRNLVRAGQPATIAVRWERAGSFMPVDHWQIAVSVDDQYAHYRMSVNSRESEGTADQHAHRLLDRLLRPPDRT